MHLQDFSVNRNITTRGVGCHTCTFPALHTGAEVFDNHLLGSVAPSMTFFVDRGAYL